MSTATKLRKGTRILFSSDGKVYEGRIVSTRTDKFGAMLVERERINPDVQEARWWRTPQQIMVLS